MDVALPEALAVFENVNVKCDIDSIYLATKNMSYVGELMDSICLEGGTVTIKNLVSRTSNTDSSRFKAVIREPEARPELNDRKMTEMALGRFPNINICSVEADQGLNYMVRYHFLGNSSINTNYIRAAQLAVITSCLNIARYYPRHPLLYPAASDGVPDGVLDSYEAALQTVSFFEGQVAYNEKNPNHRVRVSEIFAGHNGRIFLKTVFQVMGMMGSNMHGLCHVSEDVTIAPNVSGFHHTQNVHLTLDEMSRLAREMFMKGCVEAQIAGCKNSFLLTEEQASTTILVNDKTQLVDHMTKMMNELRVTISGIVDPDITGASQGMQASDLTREIKTEGVIRCYDIGFVFRGMDNTTSLLPSGPNSMYWMKRLLSGQQFSNHDDNNHFTRALFELALGQHDTLVLEGMIEALELEFVQNGTVGFDSEPLREMISNPPNTVDGDYDIALLEFIQNYSPTEENPLGEIPVSSMIDLILGNRFRPYNIFGTNGKFANVHSGKVHLDMTIQGDGAEPGSVQLSPKLQTSNIRGVQIYCPEERSMFLSRVRSHLNELLKLPDLLLKLLSPEQLDNGIITYDEVREEIQRLIARVTEMVVHCNNALNVFSSTTVRMEYFCMYQPGYDFEHEFLENLPSPSMCMKAYNSTSLKSYISDSINRCHQQVVHLVQQDSANMNINRRSNFAVALQPDHITTYILLMEKLLVNLGIGLYQGNYIQRMQKRRTTVPARMNNFFVPPLERSNITDAQVGEMTGLDFVVPTQEFMARPLDDHVHAQPIVIRGRTLEPHVIAEAMAMRNRVSNPLVYAQGIEKIRCMLLSSTRGNVPTYTPLDSIDYSAIASNLTDEERWRLVEKLVDELWAVYHYSWYKQLVQINKREGLGTAPTYDQFPRDSDRLNNFIDGRRPGDFPHVDWRGVGTSTIVTQADAIFGRCFGDGLEGHSSWTRDATWKLARVLEKVWDSIFVAGHANDSYQDWGSQCLREEQTGPFSRDHLKFVIAKRLNENTRQEEGRVVLPIIWHTTPTRRNKWAGSACKVRFEIAQIPPAPAAQNQLLLPVIENLEDVNQSASLTEDDFWTAICLPCKTFRLDYLILYRAVYVYIVDNCSDERIRPAQVSVYNTLKDAWQGPSGNLAHLWDTKTKCIDFIKNRLSAKGNVEHSYTDARFLSPNGLWAQGGNKRQKSASFERKSTAEKALLGFGERERLYQLFESSPGAQEQEKANFFSDTVVPEEQRQTYAMYLEAVEPNFLHLPRLIRYCSDNGIIGSGLTQKLLVFRLEWNQNRRSWALAQENGVATEEQRNANVDLLKNAGFQLGSKGGSLYSIKAPRERSGKRS